MKTLLSPDLDAQPLLLVDCEARSREALEKNLTRMGIRWHHLTGDEALPPLTPCAVLVELEAFASPLTFRKFRQLFRTRFSFCKDISYAHLREREVTAKICECRMTRHELATRSVLKTAFILLLQFIQLSNVFT